MAPSLSARKSFTNGKFRKFLGDFTLKNLTSHLHYDQSQLSCNAYFTHSGKFCCLGSINLALIRSSHSAVSIVIKKHLQPIIERCIIHTILSVIPCFFLQYKKKLMVWVWLKPLIFFILHKKKQRVMNLPLSRHELLYQKLEKCRENAWKLVLFLSF